jgi:O-antigen ligase
VLPFRLFELDRFLVPKEVVLHATAALSALLLLPGRSRLDGTPADVLFLAYLGLTILSATLAPNPWLALRAVGITWSGLVLFWSGRELARAGLERALLVGLCLAAIAGILTALLQAYGLTDSVYFSRNRAPGGTFGNRNFAAHLAALGLPSLLLVAVQARRAWGYWLGVVGILLSSTFLVLSRSRAAWLAVLASVAVGGGLALAGGLWRDAVARRRLRGPLLAIALGCALALALPNALNWRSDSPYADTLRDLANFQEGSGRGRLIQWARSLVMAAHDPMLGVGPGNWPVRYPGFAQPDDPSLDGEGMAANPWPSSDWVALLSERGLPAFLCLVLAGLSLFIAGVQAWLGGRRDSTDLAGLTLAMTLAATVVVGAFDAVLLLPVPALFAWVLLGVLSPVDEPYLTRGLRLQVRLALAAGAVLIGAGLTFRSASQGAAMGVFSSWGRLAARAEAARIDPGSYRIRILLAESYRRRGRCRDAVPHARAAGRLFPEAPAPQRILRACGAR